MPAYQIKYGLEIANGSLYGPEEAAALQQVLNAGAPSCGANVKKFEELFATYTGSTHALAVTSATTGLSLCGIAVGLQVGDEIITTPNSWVATAMAFTVLGAKVVFCDTDPRTLNLDPACLEKLFTPRTRAIVPVHLYGQCCDMDAIMEIARRHGVAVIEDCAHSPGATFKGRQSGSLGDMAVFSFHQQKNLSTLGEGGLITTSNRAFFERALSYRSLCCRTYGGSTKYLPIDEEKFPMNREYWRLQFDDAGYNFRMTDAQAAVGIVQLARLDGHNRRRAAIAARITSGLKGITGLDLPYTDPRCVSSNHLYVVQLTGAFPLAKRDFMWRLYTEHGIKVWSHYTPIHLTTPYARLGHTAGECPQAEAAFGRYVSLPIHPGLTDEAIDYMTSTIRTLAANPPSSATGGAR